MYTVLLFLTLLFPQQVPDPIKIKCVIVNLSVPVRLACNDKDKTELEFPVGEWPEAWAAPGLAEEYNAELRDGNLFAVETLADPKAVEIAREKMLREMRRWRIPPLQQSGRPE